MNLGLFAILAASAELTAQRFFPRRLEGLFNDPQVFIRGRPFVVPHEQRGLALAAGYEGERYRINSAGFRGDELPDDLEGRAIVLALGESSTFGWLVDEEDTYPAQLQRLLDGMATGRRPLVINAGVPSYTSAQVRLYLDELLEHYRPTLVLVHVLWNDALFACLDPWMPEYLIIQQPRPWKQFLLRHSAVFRAVLLRPHGEAARQAHNPAALRFYADNLAQMVRACKTRGAQVVFVRPPVNPASIPAEGMKIWRRKLARADFTALLAEFDDALEQVTVEQGILVVEHRLTLPTAAMSAHFLDPVHLDGTGNRILAEDIAASLQQRGLLPGVPRAIATAQE